MGGWLTGREEGSGLLISDADVILGWPLTVFFTMSVSDPLFVRFLSYIFFSWWKWPNSSWISTTRGGHWTKRRKCRRCWRRSQSPKVLPDDILPLFLHKNKIPIRFLFLHPLSLFMNCCVNGSGCFYKFDFSTVFVHRKLPPSHVLLSVMFRKSIRTHQNSSKLIKNPSKIHQNPSKPIKAHQNSSTPSKPIKSPPRWHSFPFSTQK